MISTAEKILAALAPYDPRPERGRNSYVLNSPLRPGSNSHAFRLTIADDGEHGAYFDHVSHDQGTLYQLAERLGIDTPRANGAAQQTSAYKDLADYANSHLGVPAEVLERAGMRNAKKDGRPAIAYHVGPHTRWRFLDGQKPKYKSDMGYERQWYGLDFAVNLALATGQPLVICNGEMSTLVAQFKGVAACCVAGGEAAIPENLITQLRAAYGGRVVVALDSDNKGRQTAPVVAQQLRDAEFDAWAVDLGGTSGFDLADFVRLHDEPMVALAACKEIGAPPRTWLAEDELITLAPPRFLIDGVIVFGEVTVVYGPGDAGKTFLVVDMVMRAAQHYNVMYVAGEDAPGIRLRKEAWQRFFKREPNGRFRLWREPITLQNDTQVEEFIAQNKIAGSRLIVFDTLSQCSSGADENDNTQMAMVMRNATRIAHECQASVIIIHHTDKAGNGFRGASAIKDNTYGFLSVFKDDDAVALECIRIKNVSPWGRRRFRLVEVPVELTVEGTVKSLVSCVIAPAQKVVNDGKKLSANQFGILEAIGAIAKGEGVAKSSDIMRYARLEGNNFYKPLNRLKDWEYIEKQDRPAGFVLTDKGRAYLRTEWEQSNGGKRDEGDDIDRQFFAVNTQLGINPDLNRSLNRFVNRPLNHDLNRLNRDAQENQPAVELRNGLSTVEMPAQYTEVPGYQDAENNNIAPTEGAVESSVEVNPSTPLNPPVRGLRGEGETGELTPGNVKPASMRDVDWPFVRRLYANNDVAAIHAHCTLRGKSTEQVLAALDKEAGKVSNDD